MCRFMIIRAARPFIPKRYLLAFADIAKNSQSLDGDWQGDGWGVCWMEQGRWEQKKSLNPVWADKTHFFRIPETRVLCVHARSASFPGYKGDLDFNQPFVNDRYAFMFNGLIQGVRYPVPVDGDIGSQKVWSILQTLLQKMHPKEALSALAAELDANARHIQALNVGLSDANRIYAFSRYASNKEYYNLRYSVSNGIKILSSEPIRGFQFYPIQPRTIFMV